MTEPSRAPLVLEFESSCEVVGERAASGGSPHGAGPGYGALEAVRRVCLGRLRGTAGRRCGGGEGFRVGPAGLLWPVVRRGDQKLHFESPIRFRLWAILSGRRRSTERRESVAGRSSISVSIVPVL